MLTRRCTLCESYNTDDAKNCWHCSWELSKNFSDYMVEPSIEVKIKWAESERKITPSKKLKLLHEALDARLDGEEYRGVLDYYLALLEEYPKREKK